MRRIESIFLMLALLFPTTLVAQHLNAQNSASSSSATTPQSSPPRSARSETARRHSYQRETKARRHPHVSKGEIAFMAAIAGTSMGIGALAAGGKGLAVGAIVGGWGAYAGHRLWNWIK